MANPWVYKNKTSDEKGLLKNRILVRSRVAILVNWAVRCSEEGDKIKVSNKLKVVTVYAEKVST